MPVRTVRATNAWRCATSGALALALLLWGRAAYADDAGQFELLKGLFYAGQYEDVVARVAILLDPSNPACATVEGAPTAPQTCHLADGVLIERSREMLVVALFALKRESDADAVMEKMLRANPAYSPEPGALPAAVVDRMREIKSRMQKELEDEARKKADEQRRALLAAQKADEEEQKWIAQLVELASKEKVIERRSRVIAFVPFGVGQLQNGDTNLGLFFMVSQAVAAASAITFGTMHAFYASVNPNAPNPITGDRVDVPALAELTQVTAIGNQVSFGTFAALAVAGVIQANVAFVPEVVTLKDRPLPQRPKPVVLPQVSVSGTQVNVGLVGTF